MSNQSASNPGDFVTALRKQPQRITAALEKKESIDAIPIIRKEDLSCEEYTTLVYELHHVHLPELQAAGMIEFDRREETVRQGPYFDEGRSLLKYGHGE